MAPQPHRPSRPHRTPITRRTLLYGAGLAAATAVAGCAAPDRRAGPDTAERTTMSPTPPGAVLIAYFSRAGENYWNGGRRSLSVGNTEVLATMIGDRIDCDTYRIEAAAPYSERYDPTVQRNVYEQNSDARPAIARPLPDLSRYSTVLIGSPIWNVQPPMIMASFLDGVDLTGVTIRPFVTYAVSGLGSTARFYRDHGVPADRLGDGLAVQSEEVGDAATAVDRWLRSASLL